MKWCAVVCAVWPWPLLAQGAVFDAALTWDCLQDAGGLVAQEACIGVSAGQCMEETPGGYSTVGMGACLAQEHQWWDARLNDSYQQLMAQHRATDAEMDTANAPMAQALQDMQRAWITYRDARCDHERATWGGGTGAGPATLTCLMWATARQTLLLEGHLR
jgi:uncharacterized protein YecT (DUF1311 family)